MQTLLAYTQSLASARGSSLVATIACTTAWRTSSARQVFRSSPSSHKKSTLARTTRRHSDIHMATWREKQVAINFTVITPTLSSAQGASSTSATTMMDQAVTAKERKSKEACRAAGWEFQPFVADTYGAIRSDAPALISRLIHRHHSRFFPLSEAEAGSRFGEHLGRSRQPSSISAGKAKNNQQPPRDASPHPQPFHQPPNVIDRHPTYATTA